MRTVSRLALMLALAALTLAGCGIAETPGPVEFPPGWPLPQLQMPPGAQRAFLADRTDANGQRVYCAVGVQDKALSATDKHAVVNKAKDYSAGFKGVEREAAFKYFDDQMSKLGYSADAIRNPKMPNIRNYSSADNKSQVSVGFDRDDHSSKPRGLISILVFERPMF